jgi:D-tagatose-1,6-bisphosphate aldolase subunit GatZ/KbaZ
VKALLEMVREHKRGQPVGMYSVCSAHPVVIEAALRDAAARGAPLLIEATSNQVNQLGGYTGMRPQDFHAFVTGLARRVDFPPQHLLLGGDHLGPNAWQGDGAEKAMRQAADMIEAYVAAGFRKVHLDCSMACRGESSPLSDRVIAQRAAQLCAVSEATWARVGGEAPVYVIGTEVPTPGGAHEALDTLAVTTPSAVDVTLDAHRAAFEAAGLTAAWSRVVALVVQPGVEFDHDKVIDYDASKAVALSQRIARESQLVFEAHSTDYQRPAGLTALVRDHFAILKVGPGVTFALRETLFALAAVAQELGFPQGAALPRTVLGCMQADPRHWRSYYTEPKRHEFDLKYSLSDRIRYYWSVPEVHTAVDAVLNALRSPMPLSLLSQYLPNQHEAIRSGRLPNEVNAILRDGVASVLRHYAKACGASIKTDGDRR